MDSPVSEQEPDFERPQSPQRLSALYQYHNAPEVAPAHGLEYDDTIYPSSDKMTLIRELPFRYHHHNYLSNYGFDEDNRPPRIIFGMKIGTFLIVALVVLLIVIGAAVGGAVGGKNLHQGVSFGGTYGHESSSPPSSSSSHSAIPTTTSTYSAPTPTYTPLSACPAANNTLYDSKFDLTAGESNLGTQHFTMYCNLVPSASSGGATKLSGAFVYSFSDCVDVCASYNFAQATTACNVAFYEPAAQRPINCWIASASSIVPLLEPRSGTDIGVLVPLPP